MFGHHDFRLGHIENLPGLVSAAHLRRHLKGAVRAALGIMVDDDIRGRGKQPRWLVAQLRVGKKLDDFRIDRSPKQKHQ